MAAIEKYDADLGGTEIKHAIELMDQIPTVKGYPRLVFLVTDGEIYETDEVLVYVKLLSKKMRFFTVGIGNSVDELLISGIARAGYGSYVFIKSSENVEKYIMKLLHSTVSPYYTNFKLEIINDNELFNEIIPKIEDIPFLLKNELFALYLSIDDQKYNSLQDSMNFEVVLSYDRSNDEKRVVKRLILDKGTFNILENSDTLHKLYAF